MPAKTKTKAQPRKRSATKTQGRSARTGQRTPAKAQPKRQPKRQPKKAQPKQSKRTVTRRDSVPELADAASRATELATDGGQLRRGGVSTVKLSDVKAHVIGRRRPADVIVAIIAGPQGRERPARVNVKRANEVPKAAVKLATDYASGKIGQTDLPDGARARLGEASKLIGNPTVHKISGRKLAACLVALTEAGTRKRSRR